MTEPEMIVLFNKLDCVLVPGQYLTEVYTREDETALCVIASRFSMVCFYDENLQFSKVTPAIIKEKIEFFKVRYKMEAIKERYFQAFFFGANGYYNYKDASAAVSDMILKAKQFNVNKKIQKMEKDF